jgi:hypothetical protein
MVWADNYGCCGRFPEANLNDKTLSETITVPTNLTDTSVSSSRKKLASTANTDNVGVTGYKIFPSRFTTPANLNVSQSASPPPTCLVQSSIPANFNGMQINAGSFIWFNANLKANGIPSTGATISFASSTISVNGTTYPVPNAEIIYSPSASCASITFDAGTNTWINTVPVSGNVDNIFFDGLALPVTTQLANLQNPVTWNGTFSTNTPGVSISWAWGAAVYTHFDIAYNNLNVKPTRQNACRLNNGDQAGTPENSADQSGMIGGASGGGGANYTGSWSRTNNVTPVCPQ